MIRLKNVSLSFSNVKILENFTLTIEKGENVCFAGPSGTGKSSALKMLQGYILPDTGNIEVNGKELNSMNIKEIRSMMAYIPQNVNLPVNNGNELLKLVNAGERKELVYHFARELGLAADMPDHPFDEMSGGEKQRVVISICLSLGREIILLDEPTSSLDNNSVSRLINVIEGLGNRTVISASHNQEWIRFTGKTIML